MQHAVASQFFVTLDVGVAIFFASNMWIRQHNESSSRFGFRSINFIWTKACVFFLTVTVSDSAKHRRRMAEDFSCRLGFSVNWESEQQRKHLFYYPAHICWVRMSKGLFDIHRHASMCIPECKLSRPIIATYGLCMNYLSLQFTCCGTDATWSQHATSIAWSVSSSTFQKTAPRKSRLTTKSLLEIVCAIPKLKVSMFLCRHMLPTGNTAKNAAIVVRL